MSRSFTAEFASSSRLHLLPGVHGIVPSTSSGCWHASSTTTTAFLDAVYESALYASRFRWRMAERLQPPECRVAYLTMLLWFPLSLKSYLFVLSIRLYLSCMYSRLGRVVLLILNAIIITIHSWYDICNLCAFVVERQLFLIPCWKFSAIIKRMNSP